MIWKTPCGNAEVRAVRWDRRNVMIQQVYTHPKHRGQGLATSVMYRVCDYLDENDLIAELAVVPDMQDRGLTDEQLVAWYEGFGFAFKYAGGAEVRMRRMPNED